MTVIWKSDLSDIIKMGFLTSCDSAGTIVWMHHLDSNETHGKKAKWELHNNVTCYFKNILEATSFNTAAVRPLTSHVTNNLNKTYKTYWAV